MDKEKTIAEELDEVFEEYVVTDEYHPEEILDNDGITAVKGYIEIVMKRRELRLKNKIEILTLEKEFREKQLKNLENSILNRGDNK